MTLVELLMGAVLTNALFLLAFGSLGHMQRTLQRNAVRSGAWAGVGVGAQLLRRDLADVDPADVVVMEPGRIVYRAWRGSGYSCGRSVDGVLLRTSRLQALRLPSPGGDSLSVFRTGVAGGARWERVVVSGPPRAGTCPDGAPALVVPAPTPVALSTLEPVRFFEIMEIRLYRSGGRWWLGARSVSSGGSIQPVAGPFAANGLAFAYLDADGVAISDPMQVSRIEVTLLTAMDDRDALGGAVSGGAGTLDSLRVVVPVPWRF